MSRHLALLRFTEQGLRNVEESSKRAGEFRAAVEAAGGSAVFQYWATGEFDGCVVFETPNDETAARLLLTLGKAGNVRTQTMQLFDEREFTSIVDGL